MLEYSKTPVAREIATSLSDSAGNPPIEIYAFGGFAVLTDGSPLSFGAKPQRKPMSLLKATLALGGSEVSSDELAHLLWPEAEGDAARNAFHVALHRLRKVLKCDHAVVLRDGRLSLNPRVCWVDTWQFDRAARALEVAAVGSATEVEPLVAMMLKLYRGPFCGSESEPWMCVARERFRMKFQRRACVAGKSLERTHRFEEAAAIYQRALELDPLGEQFYRGLMACRRESGHIAEALDVYRRCREILSITLGVPPSEDTQAIYRLLLRHDFASS